MQRISISMILILFWLPWATTQPCLPEGIELSSQAQINNFQLHHPGCTEIEGDVSVRGNDITNLNGLANITRIEGDLWICYNPVLTSLSGLGNLTFVGGNLSLGDRNYTGQPWNPSLQNINALIKLEHIGGDLELYNNTSLISLEGLNNLESVGGDMLIGGNIQISDLHGLNNLGSIGASLLIDVNHSLNKLTGLDKLSSVGGSLGIYNNPSLSSLSGLNNLQDINGNLWIEKNEQIVNLSGLGNLGAGSILNLSISENSSLSSCEVKSICDYLQAPGGTVEIANNATGCNNRDEVEIDCEDISVDENTLESTVILYPNPATDELNISAEGYGSLKLGIYSPAGQLLLHERSVNSPIDISGLRAGMYIVELTIEGRKIRRKLLVE